MDCRPHGVWSVTCCCSLSDHFLYANGGAGRSSLPLAAAANHCPQLDSSHDKTTEVTINNNNIVNNNVNNNKQQRQQQTTTSTTTTTTSTTMSTTTTSTTNNNVDVNNVIQTGSGSLMYIVW